MSYVSRALTAIFLVAVVSATTLLGGCGNNSSTNDHFLAGVHSRHTGYGISDGELISSGHYVCDRSNARTSLNLLRVQLYGRNKYPLATSDAVVYSALDNYCPSHRVYVFGRSSTPRATSSPTCLRNCGRKSYTTPRPTSSKKK